MKEFDAHTKYELVERLDPKTKQIVLVAHPINPIDHGPQKVDKLEVNDDFHRPQGKG